MRLIKPNEEPVGGWKYRYQDGFKNWYLVPGDSLNTLVKNVTQDMRSNNIEVPGNLRALIEDQICMKQPKGRCAYDQGMGDAISKAVHTFAGGIDMAAAKIGVKTKFEKRARECFGCAKRRMKING